jgi:hypothetical protein
VDVDGVEETGSLTEIENIFSEPVREEDSKVYNINGQRLGSNSLQKGIYIKNGKKFIVK